MEMGKHQDLRDVYFSLYSEAKEKCSKCEGKGCKHCKDTGYHTESAVPGKPAERLGAVTAIPKDEREAAAERIRQKTAAKRKERESTQKEELEIEEGMSLKDFKANRKKNERRAASADAEKRGHVGKEWHNTGRKYSADEAKSRRAKMSDDDRAARHRSAVDPDDDRDENTYSADKTKNPKKQRKQKAMGEGYLEEKSLSKAQQRFMGMVYAAKKGETPASPEVAKAAEGMSKKAAKDFAKTKHEGLPEKKGRYRESYENYKNELLEYHREKYSSWILGLEEEGYDITKWEPEELVDTYIKENNLWKSESTIYDAIFDEGIKQARKNVGASKCWTGKKLGNPPTKMKGGKEVPNCVPEETEHLDELNRYEKETGKSTGPSAGRTGVNTPKAGTPIEKGGTKDKALRHVKKMMRNMQGGKEVGQRKKEKGKKPPKAGEWGAPKSPAQKVAQRRAEKKRSEDNRSSRFD